ncbi:DNA helicase [Leisingera sp. ANG-Vp]|uniref:DNA helicase n=1 Tax=Leisingera sp. ANG-Vp TaxID=1577896 RepID=UPI00057D7D9A|nr:DNA helicase [Leisingera sp. ANG-Vp]KIC13898.1 DNA helicase [Leisingera sp. ANG-Vp]
MRLSSPVFRLKRRAKELARKSGVPLHAALDGIARKEGFQTWSHLAAAAAPATKAGRLLNELPPGGLVLLAARPGQGKTLLGLELLLETVRAGQSAAFFTLEYTEAQARARLSGLGGTAEETAQVAVDASEGICADHIIARLAGTRSGTVAVVDYLQIMDQQRSKPELAVQAEALSAFAQRSGAVIVLISQITRAFDDGGAQMPGLADVRLPNPLDLSLFSKACFLHGGDVRLATPG